VQSKQSDEADTPLDDVNLPAEQDTQAVEPLTSLYAPAVHTVHTLVLPLEKLPLLQFTHFASALEMQLDSMYMPPEHTEQSEHTDAPFSEYFPVAQAVHALV
jgi:hypothetical protein